MDQPLYLIYVSTLVFPNFLQSRRSQIHLRVTKVLASQAIMQNAEQLSVSHATELDNPSSSYVEGSPGLDNLGTKLQSLFKEIKCIQRQQQRNQILP